MAAILQFVSGAARVPMTARLVMQGDILRSEPGAYGGQPLIEFYDRRLNGSQHGRFIGSYFADLLVHRGTAPLAVDLNEPEWHIDAVSMGLVSAWIANHYAGAGRAVAAPPAFEPF
jgi:hypothetical protein